MVIRRQQQESSTESTYDNTGGCKDLMACFVFLDAIYHVVMATAIMVIPPYETSELINTRCSAFLVKSHLVCCCYFYFVAIRATFLFSFSMCCAFESRSLAM